jgi:hypothetical protein
MTARREEANQVLQPGVLLSVMKYLANVNFPSESKEYSEAIKENGARGTDPVYGYKGKILHQGSKSELHEVVYDPGDKPQFVMQLRERTQRYWPDLWKNELQACRVLKRIQVYLRRFWREQDQHARDWYIHRARHLVQRFRVQNELGDEFQQKLETVNDALRLNARIEELLDNPPIRIPFEEALYELQRRALIPSRRPLYCLNENCTQRYFLSEKKGTKFCSPECARPALLASKSNYARNRRKK